jgi:multicomponent Na+:H+ antiporter subunit D
MIAELNPGLVLIVGALLLPLMPRGLRAAVSIALPAVAMLHLFGLPFGEAGKVSLFGLDLVTLRVDQLSFLFGAIFLFAAFAAAIYSAHVDDWVELMGAHMYAGSAIGAVFSGDLVTLFVFWEITAITSVFLIWARRTQDAYDTGMRYLIVQIGSGVLLLAGVMIHAHTTGSIAFAEIAKITLADPAAAPLAAWVLLLAIGIKAGFPLLHAWLPDAYPRATVTGSVWLSAFTTKLAIYTLMRTFPGSDILIPIGATMAVFPLIFALVANDLRRALSYALINQLGLMVVAIGIGTELALNGAAAHAFCHILYKSILFMSMGAVLYRTGTIQADKLGGLAASMPWATAFCILGALAMSTPLFAGYVSKSFVVSAAEKYGPFYAWAALMFASAAVFLAAGLRVTYEAFFGGRRTHTVDDAPMHMVLAMGLITALAVLVGVQPELLYRLLPYPVDYQPYTAYKVVTQLQLLVFTALAYVLLVKYGRFPRAKAGLVPDVDWFYRKLGYNLTVTIGMLLRELWAVILETVQSFISSAEQRIGRTHNPDGILGRTWTTGTMAFWATAMLAGYLILFYVRYLPSN